MAIPPLAQSTPEQLRAEMVRLIRKEGVVAIAELATRSGVSRPHLANFMSGKTDLATERVPAVSAALHGLAIQAGDLASLRSEYRSSLEQVTRSFDLRFLVGADIPEALHNPRLEEYFVEPHLTELNSPERITLTDALTRHSVLSIFGPAGSGKTTLLAQESVGLIGSEDRLPIYFPLNALSPMLRDDRRSGGRATRNLLDAIGSFYESRHGVSVRSLFADAITRGQVVVMLDGLDEVTPEFIRPAIELINEFIESGALVLGNRVIVTERGTATFGKGSLVRRSTVFHMCPFERSEQKQLVRLWLDLASDDRDSEKEREKSLLVALESQRLADLTANPLFLTLLTIVVITGGPQHLFDEPSRAGLLDTFVRTILDRWNSLRARDRRPTPVNDEFGEYVSQFLLASLAQAMLRPAADEHSPWEIADEIGIIEAEAKLLEVYRAERGTAEESPLEPDLRDRIRGFLERCRRAGLLLDFERRVKFAHQIVRDWFLGSWLSQRPDVLESHLRRVLARPSQEYHGWEQPLAFALAALVVVRRDHFTARRLAQLALDVAPLDDARLQAVLPLGIEICASFTMAAPALPLVDADLVPKLMLFYEKTDYALVTNHLQPMMVGLVDRAPKKDRRPRSVTALQREIAERSSIDDASWVEWVERVWRYQTDFACLRLLAEHVQDRRLPQPLEERLLRRILFGMNFVADFGREASDFLEEIVRERVYGDSRVREIALYTLFVQRQRLLKQHPDSPIIPRIDSVLAATTVRPSVEDRPTARDVPELVHQLKAMPIRLVIERSDLYLREFREATNLSLSDCREALLTLIEQRNQEKPRRTDVRETAVALVLIARLYSEARWSHNPKAHDQDAKVLEALLGAAEVSDAAQFENVGACQVYDFAVWALRSIFLGSFEVEGLPLPPADLTWD